MKVKGIALPQQARVLQLRKFFCWKVCS